MKLNEIANLQPSKIVVPALAKKLNLEVKEGYTSAVEQATRYDFIIKVLSKAKEELKDTCIEEIEKGETSKNGYKLEVSDYGKYDFSTCKDPVWNQYSEALEQLTTLLKEREKFLKALPYEGMVITDQDTGETCKVYPPKKSISTSPKFTLQK